MKIFYEIMAISWGILVLIELFFRHGVETKSIVWFMGFLILVKLQDMSDRI